MVQMTNILNSSQQATGYVLVKVEQTRPPMIAVGCVIKTLCSLNLQYQFVNPTTQVALFSLCLGNCSSIQKILWNVYSGQANSSLWILFNQTQNYFFGKSSSNFTVTNQLFLLNPNIKFWKFEVVYSFANEISTSALNFVINQPPVNGSCSLSPSNGTTTTLFQISCLNWFDEDGIKDYSLYSFTNQLIIAFSSESSFKVYLPSGENQILFIEIRDQLNCLTRFNLSLISIEADFQLNNNLLVTGNQNTVSQLLTSFSQQFNKINEENINRAVSTGIPISTISISSLTTQNQPTNSSFNQSALVEFEKELNSQSETREYLISFTRILLITTVKSIELQSSSLVQLTKSTNELTRNTISIAADRCFRLTLALQSISTRISREDAEICATQLFQCASNVLSAVNGPLQQRTTILDLDSKRATEFPQDYETDLESEWSKINLLNENEKNIYQQKELANQIETKMKEMISRLNSILNIHLNVGQQSIVNTSEVFMSLQSETIESLSNKQFAQGLIRFSSIETNQTEKSIRIQSKVEPLASFSNSVNTNVSRSISFSLFDSDGKEISLDYPIQILIPRDPNRILPPMILQNVTSRLQLFNFHYVNITTILSISVHIEIEPVNSSVGYLLIYKFDKIPQLNEINGWTVLCPENFHSFFVDNEQTRNHKSLVFGLRELNSSEIHLYCLNNKSQLNPPITNERFNFTSNYGLRVYSSGCYFLDENNEWNDRGLRVGNKTNHDQTHCLTELN